MPPSPPTQQMGEKHELYLAEVNGGAKTRASGSQWFDQGDGRNGHDGPFAFCWDGKSSLGKSISVTREMLAKIREQAQGERPQIGIRFYGNANLDDVDEDWVAVQGADWEEVLSAARAWTEVESALGSFSRDDLAALALKAGMVPGLRRSLADAQQALIDAGEALTARTLELETLRSQQGSPALAVPPEAVRHLPRLPWGVIRLFSEAEHQERAAQGKDRMAGEAADYAADGMMRGYEVKTVHVDRSTDNRPRLFVDMVRVRNADVYAADGHLMARVWQDNPAAEEG